MPRAAGPRALVSFFNICKEHFMISIHLPDRRPGLRLAKMFVGILAIAILSHGASAAASADGTYTINLSPPAKAGDKYRYSSTATEKVKSTVLMAGRDPVVQDR